MRPFAIGFLGATLIACNTSPAPLVEAGPAPTPTTTPTPATSRQAEAQGRTVASAQQKLSEYKNKRAALLACMQLEKRGIAEHCRLAEDGVRFFIPGTRGEGMGIVHAVPPESDFQDVFTEMKAVVADSERDDGISARLYGSPLARVVVLWVQAGTREMPQKVKNAIDALEAP